MSQIVKLLRERHQKKEKSGWYWPQTLQEEAEPIRNTESLYFNAFTEHMTSVITAFGARSANETGPQNPAKPQLQ